jgi:hypothetical protein
MTLAAAVLTLIVTSALLSSAEGSKTYVGVITDTMCVGDHTAMKVTPDAKCVKDCVRDGKAFQYALLDGTKVYKLSDQETPARFAGRKVKVTGVLYTKTSILKVERIDASN